jgi:hypothetical protein
MENLKKNGLTSLLITWKAWEKKSGILWAKSELVYLWLMWKSWENEWDRLV